MYDTILTLTLCLDGGWFGKRKRMKDDLDVLNF